MSSRFWRRAALPALAFAAAALAALDGCTEGATPDCSDAATGCSPDVDGTTEAANGGEGGPAPDAAPPDALVDGPPGDGTVPDGMAGDASSDGARASDADGGGLLDARDG